MDNSSRIAKVATAEGRVRNAKFGRVGAAWLVLALGLTACGGEPNDLEAQDGGTATEPDSDAVPSGDETYTLDFEHGLTLPDTVFDRLGTEVLPQVVSEATDGRVEINVIYGQAGENDLLENMASGRVDGGILVATRYAGSHPLWQYGEIGFLWGTIEEFRDAHTEEANQFLMEAVEEEGDILNLSGPIPWDSGVLYTNVPLETQSDWEGLRLRSPGIEVSNVMEALGASAVTMPFGEVYPAVERGVIDGFESSMLATFSINPWEITDYLDLWPIGYSTYHVVVNEESFAQLPEELREQVREAMREFQEIGWDETVQADHDNVERLEAEGLTPVRPSDEEVASLTETVGQDLLDNWLERTGEDGQRLLELLGKL